MRLWYTSCGMLLYACCRNMCDHKIAIFLCYFNIYEPLDWFHPFISYAFVVCTLCCVLCTALFFPLPFQFLFSLHRMSTSTGSKTCFDFVSRHSSIPIIFCFSQSMLAFSFVCFILSRFWLFLDLEGIVHIRFCRFGWSTPKFRCFS